MDVVGIIISTILTALAYLIVPIIFAIRGKEIKVKKVAIINFIIVWLILTVIVIELNGEGTAGGILWAWVGYFIMKKRCGQKDYKNSSLKQTTANEYTTYVNDGTFESEPNAIKSEMQEKESIKERRNVKRKRKNKKLVVFILILTILLIGSTVLNIFQYTLIREKQKELVEQEQATPDYMIPEDYYKYMEFWNENREKLSFYDRNIVFVLEGDDTYYYTYDQMMKVVNSSDDEEFSYWAYNEQHAINLGYEFFPENLTFQEYTKRVLGN